MRNQLALVAGVVSLSLSMATSAVGQVKAYRPGAQVGPVAGVNIFTLGGSDASGAKSRTSFYVGGALTLPIGEHTFVELQLLYAGKGASTTVYDPSAGNVSGELKLAYLEVPVLLGYSFAGGGGISPRIYVGPTVGVNLSCDVSASAAGLSYSASCGANSVKTVDIGVTGGAGIAIPVGRAALSLGARYTLGLTPISDGGNSKNQGFSIGAGLVLPLGAK